MAFEGSVLIGSLYEQFNHWLYKHINFRSLSLPERKRHRIHAGMIPAKAPFVTVLAVNVVPSQTGRVVLCQLLELGVDLIRGEFGAVSPLQIEVLAP